MEFKEAFKSKTNFTIDCDDFDRFVESKYGGNLEFVAQHEANNYSNYDFSAPNQAMFFSNEAEEIRNGDYNNHSIHKIFQVLFEDGFIEEGEYLIEVNW